MPFAESQAGRIYWKREGRVDAPALVLLNSIGTDMDLWTAMLPDLRRGFRLLRIDTRGHGASDAPAGDYRMGELAGDVRAAMDAAGFPTATIAGVSLGGMIAMQMALDAPDRVSSLALICTSATMDRAAWTDRVARVRAEGMAGIADLAMSRFLSAEFMSERPEVAATIRDGLLLMNPQGYAGCGAAIRDMKLASRLSEIGCRTLVVTGERDASTPYQGHGEHLLIRIRGAAHLSLPAAHLAPVEAPEALNRALISFAKDQAEP